uniref:receptor protein-tyrosine kinase n=2 Tax=Schistocephalus solidus TaxID=70667 RepID=A0A0V0JBB4_SCHSO
MLTPIAAARADEAFNQTHFHELRPGPLTDLFVDLDVRRLHLRCPPTHRTWFLPQTLTPSLQTKRLKLSPDSASSNYLDVTFSVTDASAERAALRGQYTCCPPDRLTRRHLSSSTSRGRLYRMKTPLCCPCCPWPEEESCDQLPWNDSVLFSPGPSCLHVFVYTGAVESTSQQVRPRWGSRFLFPCPLPAPPPPSGGNLPLKIYRQIENIPASRELWFSSRKLAGGHYDPRIGLCSHHRQLGHYFMIHVCEYMDGSKRILKVRPPPAPPSLPPTVRLLLGTQSSQSPLTAVPRLKNEQEAPTFRTTLGSKVALLCEATYTTMIIIQQPPRLCFRWRLVENDTDEDWLPIECLQMKPSLGRRSVYAQHRYHFAVRRPVSVVECEVTEISRATDPQRAAVRLEAINATEKTSQIFSSLIQENGSNYQIFHGTTGDNLTTTLFVHDTSQTELFLTFFSYNEIGTNAGCFDPFRSANETVVHLSRSVDRWVCAVQLPQGVQNMLVTLRQGNLQTNISIYTSPQYSVSGLHGFLNYPFNLSCVQHSVVSRTITEMFAQSLTSIQWLVFTDGVLFLNQSESKSSANLILPPFVSDSALSRAPVLSYTKGRTILLGSQIEESKNIDKLLEELNALRLPNMQTPPRNICVSCEAYHTGWTGRSPLVCQSLDLSDDFFTYPVSSSFLTDAGAPKAPSWLPSMKPIGILGPDPSISFRVTVAHLAYASISRANFTELTVFNGSRLELRCAITLTKDDPGSSSWPLVLHFPNTTEPRALLPVGKVDFFARPLSAEVHLSTEVDNFTASGVYRCLSSSKHPQNITPHGLSLRIKPTMAPVIMEPKFPVRYFIPGELIRLVCRATGTPPPLVVWSMTAQGSVLQTSNETRVLRQCKGQIEQTRLSVVAAAAATTTNSSDNQTPSATVCNLVLSPSNSTHNITVQCVAVNFVGEAKSSLSLVVVFLGSASSKYAQMFHRVVRSSVFWITFPLMFAFCLFIGLATCIYKKSRKIAIAEKLIQMDNLLYARPSKSQLLESSSASYPSNQLFIKQLMPSEEMRKKWCLDRRNLKGLSKPLGTGHYGTVLKGVYVSPNYKNKKSADYSFFVAVKTPSTELSSLTCFRNELLHLIKLSGGPNIVSLIGCIVGVREDMSDSLLLMEFCPNTSLSEYLVRVFHPRHYQGNLVRTFQSVEGTSNTLSTRLSSTTFPYETFSGNTSSGCYVSVLQPQPAGSSILRGLYRDSGLIFSRHRRARTGNSFVYQRIDGDYSTFLMGIAQGIARGLEFLSQNFVIHRDIATRNILLDSRQVPKICDFGLAVTVERDSLATDGTNLPSDADAGCYRIITFAKQLPFRILPPEALSKQMFYLTSDVWEFGLLLWQMFFLETRKPFESIQTSEALLRLLYSTAGDPPDNSSIFPSSSPPTLDRPPAVSSALWTLMCDCWRLEPTQRPSATQVRQRIDDCIALLTSAYAPSEQLDSNSDSVSYQILRRHSVTSEMPELACGEDPSAECLCTSPQPRSYENVGPSNGGDADDYLEARASLCSV